jgi:hypothetical protein
LTTNNRIRVGGSDGAVETGVGLSLLSYILSSLFLLILVILADDFTIIPLRYATTVTKLFGSASEMHLFPLEDPRT